MQNSHGMMKATTTAAAMVILVAVAIEYAPTDAPTKQEESAYVATSAVDEGGRGGRCVGWLIN